MRAQISAYGKTTSLGDHDTEEEAARAFDKAVINKDCWAAKTNFPIDEYADQVNYIHGASRTNPLYPSVLLMYAANSMLFRNCMLRFL